MKDNWMSIVGTVIGGGTAIGANVTADRLWEVLTIDNRGEDDLYYIDIDQDIKMLTHDITASSIHSPFG